MKTKIILITGADGVGKDTHAINLRSALQLDPTLKGSYYYRVMHFASPVKRIVSALVGLSEEAIEIQKRTSATYNGMTIREWLQKVGQGMKRLLHPGIWVDVMLREINQIRCRIQKDVAILVPDFRFEEEYRMLREHGYQLFVVSVGEPPLGLPVDFRIPTPDVSDEEVNAIREFLLH